MTLLALETSCDETSAAVIRDGVVVGAVQVDYQADEVIGGARRLAYGVAAIAIFWIAVPLTGLVIVVTLWATRGYRSG